MKKKNVLLVKKLTVEKERIVVLAENGNPGVIPSCMPECYRVAEVIPSCMPECY